MYAFRSDLDKGKACWVNSFFLDYFYWQSNYHSLLSIVFAPKHHPYSRIFRIIIFLCVLLVSIFFSMLTWLISPDNSNSNNTDDTGFFTFVISIVNGLIITSMTSSMKFFAICLNNPKIRDNRSGKNNNNNNNDNSQEYRLVRLFRMIGIFGIFGWILFALFIFIISILISYLFNDTQWFSLSKNNTFLIDFLYNLCVGWMWNWLLQTLFFVYYWQLEKSFKSRKALKNASQYYVTYIDYIRWQYRK